MKNVRTADFLNTFTLTRASTKFASGVDTVSIGSQHVAYIHFNGHCKSYMCLSWICENVHRWAKKQMTMPDLSALKYCCDFEPTRQAL